MIVKKQSKARVFQLSRSLKSLGRSVGRRNRSSIARQVVKDNWIRKKVVERMGKLLSKELTNLASLKTNSLLRNRSCEALEQFSWQNLLAELEKEAPITLSLLKQCAHVKRRVHKPCGEGGRSRRRIPNEEAAVGMCFAILMRARSHEFGATLDFNTALWKSRTKTSEPLLTKMYYTVSISNLPSCILLHIASSYIDD